MVSASFGVISGQVCPTDSSCFESFEANWPISSRATWRGPTAGWRQHARDWSRCGGRCA